MTCDISNQSKKNEIMTYNLLFDGIERKINEIQNDFVPALRFDLESGTGDPSWYVLH